MHFAEGTLTYRGMEGWHTEQAWHPVGIDPHTCTNCKIAVTSIQKTHYRPWNRRQIHTFNKETHSHSHTSCITNWEAHVLHMKSPPSKYSTFEKFLQVHAFTGTRIHSNFHLGVAKYVFYQLKSVTLSFDLNIYALFPGQCCITGKLFILVSVGPIFSVMIEYKMEAHSVVWRIIGGKRLCLSCFAHLFFHLIGFVTQSQFFISKLSFTFYFLVILLYILITCLFHCCSHTCQTVSMALLYPVSCSVHAVKCHS